MVSERAYSKPSRIVMWWRHRGRPPRSGYALTVPGKPGLPDLGTTEASAKAIRSPKERN